LDFDQDDSIFVLDRENNRVEKFDRDWNLIATFGSYGTGPGQFRSPSTISFDYYGNVFVSDYNQHRIEKFGCAN
jgi:tripartite motif-containing protein 71